MTHDTASKQPAVALDFTRPGQTAFAALTRDIARRGRALQRAGAPTQDTNQHLAIILDGRLVAVPFIDARLNPYGIDGRAGSLIEGGITTRQATIIAALLDSGRLPRTLIATER